MPGLVVFIEKSKSLLHQVKASRGEYLPLFSCESGRLHSNFNPKSNTRALSDDLRSTTPTPDPAKDRVSPGSKATYEKIVDKSGNAVGVTKTTVDPKGDLVHVKDKLIDKSQ